MTYMMNKDELIAELREALAQKDQIILELTEKIKVLEQRLNKHSQNSSKPPSSDGLKRQSKRRNTSLREKGKRPSGGQVRHQGHTLKPHDHPDEIVIHALDQCPRCDTQLSEVPVESCTMRQVIDISKPTVEVTEHQAQVKICPGCQARVKASFPKEVKAPVQYGERVRSEAVYLQGYQLIPQARTQAYFTDQYGLRISTATLSGYVSQGSKDLVGFTEQVREGLIESELKHLDETGLRVSNKTQWLHVMSNETMTYYEGSGKRSTPMTDVRGLIVHDHWRPYFKLEGVTHALCHAHHLRELNALIEGDEVWAAQMKQWFMVGLRLKHRYAGAGIPEYLQRGLLRRYDQIVEAGLSYHEGLKPYKKQGKRRRGKQARRPGHNLVLRLRDHRASCVRYIQEVKAPFTNNQAERDLRMMKVRQKISGCFRSTVCADEFIRMRGFFSTACKQGWDIMESLRELMSGQPPQLAPC